MSEQAIASYIKSLPNKQPGIALDIGANHGMYTDLIASKFDHCYAFECDPTNQQILQHNVKSQNVTIIREAVGRVNGQIKLFLCGPNPGGHTTVEMHTEIGTWGHKPENWIWVPSVTLNTFWKHVNKPIKFIKCDIEGAESFVFNYGKELLSENKLTMLIEVHRTVNLDHLYDLFTTELGYKVYYLDDDKSGSSLEAGQNVGHMAGQEADMFGYDIHYIVTNER